MVRRLLGATALSGLGLAAALAGGWALAVHREDPALAHLRSGTDELERGAWEGAAGELRLALAAQSPPVRAVAWHNLGLALLRSSLDGEGAEALELAREARDRMEESLRLNPGNPDVGWNLEVALRRVGALEDEESRDGTAEARRLLASLALAQRGRGGVGPQVGSSDGKGRESPGRKGPPW